MNTAMSRLYKHPTHESFPGYWQRHEAALSAPRGVEEPIVRMLSGWLGYADAHRERFMSGIGEDYVLGPEWRAIGLGIRGLLNGALGRLDAGAIDSILVDELHVEGLAIDL